MEFVVAIGTRPDVIKMRPIIDELRKRGMNVRVWWSGQGKDIQDGAVLPVDCDIGHVEWNKGLADGVGQCIGVFGRYLSQYPDHTVLVHGDDATAYGAAVGAYLQGNMVVHIEAGLRTYESTPYPEEAFRKSIATMADVHFAVDQISRDNLMREKVNGLVYTVGNTIVDVVGVQPIRGLVTLHRRENWGAFIQDTLACISDFADSIDFTVIRHPNWAVHLGSLPGNLFYVDPLGYREFQTELKEVDLVITDSGGLQEECAVLGIPCYVMRTSTERTALKENKAIVLCATPQTLRNELESYIYRRFTYGKPGTVSTNIVNILEKLPHEAD